MGVTYAKTFVQPDEESVNLFLDSLGTMRIQDVDTTPDSYATLFSVVPNTYASSVTTFGREYMAFHDGQKAKDIPRQYDPSLGVRRITQDGPACGPGSLTAADAPVVTIPISTIVPKGPKTILTAVNNSGVVTITTATNHGLNVGDSALIQGVSQYQYNGNIIVATVPTLTSITYNAIGSGWPPGSGGQIIPLEVTVTTTIPHGLISGETIVITGDSDKNYDNSTTQSLVVTLATNTVCNFYNGTNAGAFSLFFPATNPLATFSFFGDDTIMFNPQSEYLGDILPGVGAFNHGDSLDHNHPMQVWGTNPQGSADGNTQVIWGNANYNWQMTVVGNISFPAAGTYYFKTVHDDGAFIGMGGGITHVSGPMNNPEGQTVTAQEGLAVVYANNSSTSFAGVNVFNDTFAVSVPAPGTYPFEIDYSNWEDKQILTLQWSSDGINFNTLVPGNPAFNTPPTWTVKNVTGTQTFTFLAVYAVGEGFGGIITVGGLVSPGTHKLCVSFQTDTDFITKPCPAVSWTSAGSKRVVVTGLPIGPPNVKARICHFTGAGGGNFFYIPVPALDPATGQQISTSTVVNDNTSTTATFDFSDNTLFSGIAIDITGNNLFNLITLGPCAGVFAYSNRLSVWGDTNKINNLLNMGFEGGTSTPGGAIPLGWTVGSNGTLVNAGDFEFAWRITGIGTPNITGLLTQPAYQDDVFVPILTPNTLYTFEMFAYCSAAQMTGQILVDLYSPTQGLLARATINASSIGVGSSNGSFVSGNFSQATPATIPSDVVLNIYGFNLPLNQTVTIDEMMMVYTSEPVSPGQARFSYAFNPESFDGVTGLYAVEYSEPLMSQKIIRDNLYTLSANHLSRTTDNGVGEPITWTNYTVSDIAGGMSVRSFDVGEGWGIFAAESGAYVFSGGEPQKISQEIQTLWNSIDPELRHHVWVKNDPINRRVYIGVPLTFYSPTNTAFTPLSCNKILVLDYRELNTAGMIEMGAPLVTGFSGKMLTTDLKRKWTVWNLPMNCGEIMAVGNDNEPQILFGSGNGQGLSGGFGNAYQLVDGHYFDDDYGSIGALNGQSTLSYAQWVALGNTGVWRPQAAYYATYFSPSHEQEQTFQTGSQRKLYGFLEAYVSGVGELYVIPLMDRLGNSSKRPPKKRILSQTPDTDTEWPLNVLTQRLALLFYALPGGVTASLSKQTMTMAVGVLVATTNNVKLTTQTMFISEGALTTSGIVLLPSESFNSQQHPFLAYSGPTNLLQNPSFWNYTLSKPNLNDWTIDSGTPDTIQYNDGVQNFVDDPNSIAIGTGNFGTSVTMHQTITTQNGHVYTFSFWVLGDGSTGTGITVFWNGTTEYTVTDLNTSILYVQHTFSVTGTGSDTVKFTLSDSSGGHAVLIDEFAVNP